MNQHDEAPDALEPLDFVSPGRFEVHNPLPPSADNRPDYSPARREQLLEWSLLLIGQARRQLALCTSTPQPWLLANPACLQALRQFLLRNHRMRLQLLLASADTLHEQFPALLVLRRRFSDRMEIRLANPVEDLPAPCLLCDDHSLLLYPAEGCSGGQLTLDDRSLLRSRLEDYNRIWAQATPLRGHQEFLL